MNNKGVSLVALVITIIVIIIIAGISLRTGIDNVTQSQKSAFLADLEMLNTNLQKYNIRAVQYNNLEGEYYEEDLQWDGKSPTATNSAQMEKAGFEDTPNYIFGGTITDNVKGKIIIKDGRLFVDPNYKTELEWASEHYRYMASGD
jgi:Tfp pilus assembly protein PilE